MAWHVKVTKKNVAEMASVAHILRSELQKMLKEVKEYPLEVCFAGYRVFFETEDDVTGFLVWLDARVLEVLHAA